MAKRRMFSQEITDSDAFLDMPLSAQALYFHLGMNADDDGFVNNPKKVQRGISASNDDMQLLVAKRFIIAFESGIIVIKHWKVNNSIRGDRRRPTNYDDELLLLGERENGTYYLVDELCQPTANQLPTNCQPNDRVGKDRLGEDRLVEEEHTSRVVEKKRRHGEFSNVLLTDRELEQLKDRFPSDWQKRIDDLSYYIGSKGDKYKSHYRTILSWQRKNEPKAVMANAEFAKYD